MCEIYLNQIIYIAAIEKEKKAAYTRTCSVKKQHELELARLKNKYVKPQLAIEETAYNDRAQARREAVGSSHHAEKTQTSDISMLVEIYYFNNFNFEITDNGHMRTTALQK